MNRGFQAGAARLLDVVGRRPWREAGPKNDLAGEVEVATVLQHRACGDLTEALPLQTKASDQAVERRGQHVLVGGSGIGAAGAGEGDSVAAEDGGAAQVSHAGFAAYVRSML